jgi:purine-cytosine permease-like protein
MENKEQPKKPMSPWGYIMMTALLLSVLSTGIFIGMSKGDMLNTIVSHVSSQGWAIVTVVLLFIYYITSRLFKNRDKSKYR